MRFDAGSVGPSEMDSLIQRLLHLLNEPEARHCGVRQPSIDQAVRVEHAGNVARIRWMARFCDGGLLDERIRRYAETLLDLLVKARAAGYSVAWA